METTAMKFRRRALLALGIVGATIVISRAQVGPIGNAEFDTFLRRFEHGTTRFINGDAAAWKANASHQDDVTLMGGWGIVTRGWDATGARYDWAAKRFADSGATLNVEYVSSLVSGDLAYTVAIEHSVVRLEGHTASPMNLRVTHLFRREQGEWKLIHRHADPILETTTPKSVLTP